MNNDAGRVATLLGREAGGSLRALKVTLTDGPAAGTTVWIPRSLVKETRRGPSDENEFDVAEWFCVKEGLV